VGTAASLARLTAYHEYLVANGSDADAQESLLAFLGWDEIDKDDFGQDVRIVLAAADFSKEITSTMLWPNEYGLEIHCVRNGQWGRAVPL
jgi:hypothetical protein